MLIVLQIKDKLKAHLGDLWWYTGALFIAQQFGALINAFIGLWLVPAYVPYAELGAVIPLTSIGTLLGLPLAIILMPVMKFIIKYIVQGEYGKVKALLRDVVLLAGGLFVCIFGLSFLFLPAVFERMRIQDGLLPLLIVSTGIISALSPICTASLQALKKFKVIVILGALGALVRLIALLIALPIRGLSGYFVGQIVALLFGIVATLYMLRKYFGFGIKVASYWSEDWKPILKFTLWNGIICGVGYLLLSVESFVIRHRLSDFESAGYYMISRFSEISLFVSLSCVAVLFPLVSEQHEKGGSDEQIIRTATRGSFLGGLAIATGSLPIVWLLFSLKADWQIYMPLIPHLFVLGVIYAARGVVHCYVVYKTAKNDFNFVSTYVIIYLSECFILYGLTGFTFFASWLPSSWMEVLAAWNPCRLSVVMGVMLLHTCAMLVYVGLQLGALPKLRRLSYI